MQLTRYSFDRLWMLALAAVMLTALSGNRVHAFGWPTPDPSTGVGWPDDSGNSGGTDNGGNTGGDPVPDPVLTPDPQPEPATIISGIVGLGLAGFYVMRYRRRKDQG